MGERETTDQYGSTSCCSVPILALLPGGDQSLNTGLSPVASVLRSLRKGLLKQHSNPCGVFLAIPSSLGDLSSLTKDQSHTLCGESTVS